MESYTPLVSIIMPAYNAENYIADSIISILNQDYENWELIVIDDGSTDKTSHIIKNFVRNTDKIKYYYQENKGTAATRNIALTIAEGDLIAFLDNDDLWLPNKLSVSVREFNLSNQDLLFTGSYIFYNMDDLKKIPDLERIIVEDKVYCGKEGVSEFIIQNRIPILTAIGKKAPMLSVAGFSDSRVAQDYGLWLKLLLSGYVLRSISDCLSVYRLREDSVSGQADNMNEVSLDLFLKLSKDYPDFIDLYRVEIKSWFKRYIDENLTESNLDQFLTYANLFGFEGVFLNLVSKGKKVLPFFVAKKCLNIFFNKL